MTNDEIVKELTQYLSYHEHEALEINIKIYSPLPTGSNIYPDNSYMANRFSEFVAIDYDFFIQCELNNFIAECEEAYPDYSFSVDGRMGGWFVIEIPWLLELLNKPITDAQSKSDLKLLYKNFQEILAQVEAGKKRILTNEFWKEILESNVEEDNQDAN